MHSAVYTGRLRHRRFGPVPHAFSYGITLLWLDLAELDDVFRGRWLWSVRRPALARFRREDYLGGDGHAARCRRARSRRSRDRPPPEGADPAPDPDSHAGLLLQSGELLLLLRRARHPRRGDRRGDHQHALERAPCVRVAHGRAGAPMRFGLSKAFHVSPFLPMDMDYDWRFSAPADTLAVHMSNLRGGSRVFDATLMLRRREISGPSLAAMLVRQPIGSLAVVRPDLLAGVAALGQARPRPRPSRQARPGETRVTDTTLIERCAPALRPGLPARIARKAVHARLSRLTHGRLRLRDGGETHAFGNGDGIESSITVLDPAFYADVALGGSVGAGESYVQGRWRSDDLTGAACA